MGNKKSSPSPTNPQAEALETCDLPYLKEDKNIICPVCLEEEIHTNRKQITFRCGHSICHDCRVKLRDENKNACPLCRIMIQPVPARRIAPLNLKALEVKADDGPLPNSEFPNRYQVSLMLLGDPWTGKTSLKHRFVDGYFMKRYTKKLAETSDQKKIKIENRTVKIVISDPANFSQNVITTEICDGYILCYDITNRESYYSVSYWIKTLRENKNQELKNLSLMILGTKQDQETHRRVNYKDGKELADRYSALFFETSSQIGTNIEDAFEAIAKDVLKRTELIIPHSVVSRDTEKGGFLSARMTPRGCENFTLCRFS